MPIIFPAHPRILKRIQSQDLSDYFVDHAVQARATGWPGADPADSRAWVFRFSRLMSEARVVLTDSGGIQDETPMLGVPCITLQDTTERPITLQQGTNVLAGSNPGKIIREFNRAHANRNQ